MKPFPYDNCDLVLRLVGNDPLLAKTWWHTPNTAFNGENPINVDQDLVKQYLEKIYHGQ